MKRKVVAYITHGDRLLMFTHPLSPEAGIQVPAGTIENDERAEDAALREAIEETGLTNLTLIQHLGTYRYDMRRFKPEIHERHVYHLEATGELPESWRHFESDVDENPNAEPIPLDFYWVPLNSTIDLIAGQGDLLHLLR